MPTNKFYDYHLPVLEDGEYEIKVTQDVEGKDVNDSFKSEPLKIYVDGPRFHLSPSEIHRVFPQDAAKGDFEGTLPSISFTRSTLLWERKPTENNTTNAPWLFLLLVDENEVSLIVEQECTFDGKNFTFKNKDDQEETVLSENLGVLDPNDYPFISTQKTITFIDLTNFNVPVIPATLDVLKHLGYTRIMADDEEENPTQRKNGDTPPPAEDDTEEHCVAVGNRLPQPGNSSTVYLISLENKYKPDGTLDSDKHKFPVLYKWAFYTNDDQLYSIEANLGKIKIDKTCKDLHDKVKNNTDVFDTTGDFKNFLKGIGASPDEIAQMLLLCKLPGGAFHDVMSNLSNGIKPLMLPNADGIKISGSVTLDYTEKSTTHAWYRGPLATQKINLDSAIKNKTNKSPLFVDQETGFIPEKADDLLIQYKGQTDATYAAAYELGKLTALNDTAFSSAFYEWKHQTAAAKAQIKLSQKTQNSNGRNYFSLQHLPLKSKYATAPDMPLPVMDKFNNWKLLKGLPIRYLVPDPTMVPSESIRYFKVDNHWVNAFIMGAFSIGHTPRVDFSKEIKALFLPSYHVTSGFFLNSIAVSVWHDYELDCTIGTKKSVPPLRKSNLNAFVHLYLFDGQISELNFHLHPGKLHPGFMVEKNADRTTYHKSGILDAITCIDDKTKIVDIKTLYLKFSVNSIAEFNGKLMEGTPEVQFTFK